MDSPWLLLAIEAGVCVGLCSAVDSYRHRNDYEIAESEGRDFHCRTIIIKHMDGRIELGPEVRSPAEAIWLIVRGNSGFP